MSDVSGSIRAEMMLKIRVIDVKCNYVVLEYLDKQFPLKKGESALLKGDLWYMQS